MHEVLEDGTRDRGLDLCSRCTFPNNWALDGGPINRPYKTTNIVSY